MRTRIKDIAERVGVSTALVSMYLNDHPLARMSEDTKRKIDEAVREMNYQPSATARSLKIREKQNARACHCRYCKRLFRLLFGDAA